MGCMNSRNIEKPSKNRKPQEITIKITANMLLSGKIDDYEVKDVIGFGTKSEIRLGIHRVSQESRAIKIYKLKELSPADQLLMKDEIILLSKLDHPNVVRCFDIFKDDVCQYIVMELCTGGELFEKILNNNSLFSEHQAANIIRQILLALNYCHTQNIIHKDLKPSNILFADDSEEAPIKILNFAFSKTFKNQMINSSFSNKSNSNFHLSPEAIFMKTEKKSDVWSVGVLLYFLVFGKPPKKREANENLEFPNKISEELENFLDRLLSKDLEKRYDAAQALEDPWLQKLEKKELSFEVSKNIYETFKQSYGSWKLQDVVFDFLYRNLALEKEKQEMKELFERFDQNKNGWIDKNEFISGMRALYGNSFSQEHLDELFEKFDTNNQHHLNYQEFGTRFSGIQKNVNKERIEKIFKMLDVDKNGTISLSEFQQNFGGNEMDNAKWKALIEKVDTNGDLQISFEEFKLLFY